MKITVKNVRLAFPHLFTPKAVGEDGKKYFKAAFPIEPDSATHKQIKEAMIAAAKEKWDEKAATIFKKLKEDRKLCFEEKSPSNDSGEVYNGFEGMYVLNATRNASRGRVTLVGRDPKKGPLAEEDGVLYGGCYVNAIVDVWAQDNTSDRGGKRINCELLGVQFVKDGEAFGGGAAASVDDFEVLEDIDEDDFEGDGVGAAQEDDDDFA